MGPDYLAYPGQSASGADTDRVQQAGGRPFGAGQRSVIRHPDCVAGCLGAGCPSRLSGAKVISG
jgi:hypothetical protein